MFYGNPTAADGQSASQVWASQYQAVYHFNANVLDSTSNGNNGADSGTTDAAGKIAHARGFASASSSQITTSYGTALTHFTITAWARGSSTPGNTKDATLLERGYNYIFTWDSQSSPTFIDAALFQVGATIYSAQFGSLSSLVWYFLSATYDGSHWVSYLNGSVANSTAVSGTPASGGGNLHFGKDSLGSGGYFDGEIDEVKISNSPVSANWISAQYLSETDSFCTYGSPEVTP
jgi:hypothetical protein